MKHALSWVLVATAVLVACGDDEGDSDATTSGSGGGTSGGACSTECATTGCADSSPDQACEDCVDTQCAAEIDACLADGGTSCGSGDCSGCGALVLCDECSDQGALDAEGQALFDAILTCMCG